ncbi:MAG: nucleotide exchange factor GrpE [Thermoleophilaceae bacterium]
MSERPADSREEQRPQPVEEPPAGQAGPPVPESPGGAGVPPPRADPPPPAETTPDDAGKGRGAVGYDGHEADGPEADGHEADGHDADGPATPEAQEPAADEDELARALRERAEYLALAQRTQADFENFRKRAAKESAAAGQRARRGLVSELLPVLDNLERALASGAGQEEHLAGGVRLVHSELVAVLARNGVEQFDPGGERFDPSFHEALSTRADDGTDAGVVLDVVEKGYRLGDAVLRPARVVVSG